VALPLITLGALAGCGEAPADPAPTAVVAPTADLGLLPARATTSAADTRVSASAGAVPDGFVPVSVLVCTPDGSLVDSSGTWLALTASHREGDLDPLVEALRHPSAEREGTCASTQVQAPALWLVDALGRAVRPAWPTDRCGVPRKDVASALAALDETDSEKYPVQVARSTP